MADVGTPTDPAEFDAPAVWFVVCDTALRDLLSRAKAGEDVGLLLIEFYANTEGDHD